jgi:pimeloyl-ACP methyl ester carboxylesterase
MKRALAIAAVVLGVASGSFPAVLAASAEPALASAVTGRAATPQALAWQACDGQFRCSKLAVPIDYAHPAAGTLELAVVELPSTSLHPAGDVVLNPGGPGASGVTFLEQGATVFPSSLRSVFNLISFDPRGIAASDPVECGSSSVIESFIAQNPQPTTKAQISAAVGQAKSFVAHCEAATTAALLDHVGTNETVDDIEQLRIALGDEKLNYLGFSYGTYLGERYAQRYPTHIRAMVLDGVIDPTLGVKAVDEAQVEGLERNLHAFFSWCAGNHACAAGLPGGPQVAYDRLFAQLQRGASIVADIGKGNADLPAVNLAIGEQGVVASLYSTTSWPFLGTALASALRGNGSDLSVLAIGYSSLGGPGGTSNLIAANTAINCEDSGALPALGDYAPFARQLATISPDFGASTAWSSFVCLYWPVAPSEHTQPIRAPGAPTILVVGSTGDPATPYAWAQAVASMLDHAVLLTRSGFGHTAYFSSSCIVNDVDRYLVDLALPAKGTICSSD